MKSKNTKQQNSAKDVIERNLSDEEVLEIVGDIFTPDILPGLSDGNWKNRYFLKEMINYLLLLLTFCCRVAPIAQSDASTMIANAVPCSG